MKEFSREWWLANNRSIMEQEQESEEEIFKNQISTRLTQPWCYGDDGNGVIPTDEFHDERIHPDDDRLGDAYIACLANHEGRGDHEYYHRRGEAPAWAPLTPEELVKEYGVTIEEARVVAKMADEEYSNLRINQKV
jgi:hypothetical protein